MLSFSAILETLERQAFNAEKLQICQQMTHHVLKLLLMVKSILVPHFKCTIEYVAIVLQL